MIQRFSMGITRKSIIYVCCFVVFLTLCFLLSPALSQDAAKYKGWSYCKTCHGPKVKGWGETRHAKALDSVKKTNQHDLPECVKCHVTGYGEPGGFIDHELTPEVAGVQCEACHGPGSNHKGGKKDIIAVPGEDKCRQCHTPGQDPKFDYKRKVLDVHGPR
jgi:predicted CXXCH cytochrome family protein